MSRESYTQPLLPILVVRGLSVAQLVCLSFVALASFTGCNSNPNSSPSSNSKAKAESGQSTSSITQSELKSNDSEPVIELQTAEKPTASEKSSPSIDGGDLSSATTSFAWHKDCGIDFVREDDMRGLKRIFESTGGGVGVIDFDLDGELDLIFTGGCKVPEELKSLEPTCAIYRNQGKVQFRNNTLPSRLIKAGFCQGIAVGDYDNDGFDDVYITALGSNGLFHNQGDGTFVELTQELGVDDSRWSTSCAFADVNLDGCLDLFVVNYLNDSPYDPFLCKNEKSPTGYEQCPPSKYEGVSDRLFLGDGAGGFIDISERCGLSKKLGKGLGVVICNFDQQGLPEIYVSNDGEANFLLKLSEDSSGRLVMDEIGMESGAALSGSGYAQASMGIAAGDYDRDGLIDLHITNFYGDSNSLYKNLGNLQFDDITRHTGLAGPSKKVLGWGTVFADFDADGWDDLFVANGHVEDRTWNGRGEPFEMQPQLFVNSRDGKFSDESLKSGEYFQHHWLGRGVATADIDHDRRVDLVVSHQKSRPAILLNQATDQHAISLRLIGTSSNRNGFGARIELQSADGQKRTIQDAVAGTSFHSSSERRLFFAPKSGTKLSVVWPSGSSQILEIVENSEQIVVEGR